MTVRELIVELENYAKRTQGGFDVEVCVRNRGKYHDELRCVDKVRPAKDEDTGTPLFSIEPQ